MPEAAARVNTKPVRPVLKWAGGKRQLLPALRPYYPVSFKRYVEPFVGSGAVFLDLHNRGVLAGRDVRLSDTNADVIGCYRAIRDDVESVIAELRALQEDYKSRGAEHFYEIRDRRFNPRRREIHAGAHPEDRYAPDLAAMLIYLNRTGYNGLFRVNSRGDFNVPAGRHASVHICDEENLRLLSAAVDRPGTSIDVRGFDDALGEAREGDFVYLDPPYAPVSRTSYFTSYTSAGFGPDEQARLQQAVIALAGHGAHVLLSNSVSPDISVLYAENAEARRAGLQAKTVEARRAINSRASARGAVLEYLITNIPEAGVVD